MGLQTKIVVSILSMVACISVMTAGIVAILMSGVSIQNNETLVMADIKGCLYGYRFGAGNHDIYDIEGGELKPVLLYKDGEVANEAGLRDILKDVSFGTPEKFIEYIFLFELDQMAETEVWVNLEEAIITSSIYAQNYQYCFQESEPTLDEWDSASTVGGTLVVNKQNRMLWLRASLGFKYHDYEERDIGTRCIWTFTFSFTGAGSV